MVSFAFLLLLAKVLLGILEDFRASMVTTFAAFFSADGSNHEHQNGQANNDPADKQEIPNGRANFWTVKW